MYRFINHNNKIVYVGRTINLERRFMNHEQLTKDIKKIEYIECETQADMVWKEIYYINLFSNDFTLNKADLYHGGVTDICLNDNWKTYRNNISVYNFDQNRIIKNQLLANDKEFISKIPLIHVVKNEKLNSIGNNRYDLSQKWFYDDHNKESLKRLSQNTTNYFRNVCKAKSSECLWTTYDEFTPLITGKGFRKGFISLNNTEVKTNGIYLAFLCNLFYKQSNGIDVDEDGYALSEMLQFIWRSAIRDGKEIWCYIPSVRMRILFIEWIDKNSFSE